MRETQFIRQNQAKWKEFEDNLNEETQDADRLRELFVQITDDLSYSRTFYPNRSVRVYLNGLAQRIYLKLYRSRRTPLLQVLTFWTDELPSEIFQARKAFRLSFFLFLLCFAIGMLSCAMDPEFAEVILGDSYVEMTRANIESGDPMRVYKERGQFNMFLGITLNNLYVAFLTFALGVFFGVGSMIIIISNAVMVGCFQYFFIQEGLFWESFLTIWIHGTLEISAIVIAGAAGITMGQGLAFPGSFSRIQAFQQSARRGAKIILGTVPLFIIAGFLEGYLTRQTETPDIIRGAFIILCLGFVLVYFVWYPWFRKRLLRPNLVQQAQRLPRQQQYQLELGNIRNTGGIFSETFLLLGRNIKAITLACIGGSLVYCILVFGILSKQPSADIYIFNNQSWVFNIYNFFLLFTDSGDTWFIPIAGGTLLFTVAAVSFRIIQREAKVSVSQYWLALLVGIALLVGCIGILDWWLVLTVPLVVPLVILLSFSGFHEKRFFPLGRAWQLYRTNIFSAISLVLLLLSLSVAVFTLFNSAIIDLFFQFINWFVTAEQTVLDEWSIWITVFLLVLMASYCWALIFLGYGLFYFSAREVVDAPVLREKLEHIGQSKRLRGLERE